MFVDLLQRNGFNGLCTSIRAKTCLYENSMWCRVYCWVWLPLGRKSTRFFPPGSKYPSSHPIALFQVFGWGRRLPPKSLKIATTTFVKNDTRDGFGQLRRSGGEPQEPTIHGPSLDTLPGLFYLKYQKYMKVQWFITIYINLY